MIIRDKEMLENLKETKSLLAKLMATENIRVEHKNIPTGAFDLKNRVLYLPMFKYMTGDIYDLLVSHEVVMPFILLKRDGMILFLQKEKDTSPF